MNTTQPGSSDGSVSQVPVPNAFPQQNPQSSVERGTSVLSMQQHCGYSQNNSFVFLSTAIVSVLNSQNKPVKCRCLLDSGSQPNIITKGFVEKLGIRTKGTHSPITGINQSTANILAQCKVSLCSLYSQFKAQVNCLVIEEISNVMPQKRINTCQLEIPETLQLADPTFYEPSQVDLLLGAGIFYDLLCAGFLRLGPQLPVLKETQLGWIVSGSCGAAFSRHCKPQTTLTLYNTELQSQLEKFWAIEETHEGKKVSKEAEACETDFLKTFTRDKTGRFTVALPLRKNYAELGDSLNNASVRFYSLERKLNRNEILRQRYVSFINEYIALGHMTEITADESSSSNIVYYLPHHGVEKENSTTTKLRVVFDGSAKSCSGLSLNDVLMVGPTIQSDLVSILLRFRQHAFVLTGDIAKMYRQVNVIPEHRDLQRILWRESPHCKLRHYKLNTITYETAPATFLATRCL